MAFTVPTYRERQVQQQGLPNVRQQMDAPEAAFGSMQAEQLMRSGTAIQKLGDQWHKKAINMQDEENELYALQLQTEAEREMSDFLYNPQQGLLTQKGRNALDAPRMTAAKIDEIQKRFNGQQNIAPEVRSMLQKSMIQIGRRYGDLANRHSLEEYTTFKNDTLDAQIEMNLQDISLNFMDDKEFQKKADESFQLLQSRATSEGWGDEQLANEKLNLYSNMRTTQITSMIATDDPQKILVGKRVYDEARARNQINFADSMKIEAVLDKAVPKAAADVAYRTGRFGSSVTDQSGIMSFVIDQMEGGDSIAQEPRGAIAKFGINSEANPDVDVANLTREGAEQLYKERYWTPYGIDEVPENMRLLAFDIAVNHRSDFAKKMVDELKSGTTPDKVMNMRLKEYKRLADSDPEQYGRYYNGWKDRLNRIATQMSENLPVDSAAIYTAAGRLDKQYPGAGAELVALYENGEKAKTAQKTARKNELQDTINQIVSTNNGDWTKVPSVLRAEAASFGIDVTAYKGVSDPDVVADIDAMTSSEILSLNLNDENYVQNLTYEKRQEYIKKQQELVKPENKYTAELVDGVVAYYFRSQGSATAYDPNNKDNKQAVASMNNYVNYRIQVERSADRDVDKKAIMRFASDYLALKKTTRVRDMFSIEETEREQIVNQLISLNIVPTPEAVWATFNATRNDFNGRTKP